MADFGLNNVTKEQEVWEYVSLRIYNQFISHSLWTHLLRFLFSLMHYDCGSNTILKFWDSIYADIGETSRARQPDDQRTRLGFRNYIRRLLGAVAPTGTGRRAQWGLRQSRISRRDTYLNNIVVLVWWRWAILTWLQAIKKKKQEKKKCHYPWSTTCSFDWSKWMLATGALIWIHARSLNWQWNNVLRQ